MNTIVIYHKADFDGLFCREICRRFYRDEAEYIGWDYGDPTPVVEPGRMLVMVDISVDGLMDHRPLIWIDHHKTAIAKFGPDIAGYRIDGVAACRLAWQWFFTANFKRNPMHDPHIDLPDKKDFIDRKVVEPYAVQLAGEYDIWDKRNPKVDIFQDGLRSLDLTPHWKALLELTRNPTIAEVESMQDTGYQIEVAPDGTIYNPIIYTILANGKVLQYATSEANASLMRDVAFELNWEGLHFLAVNKPHGNSRTFAAGVKPEHDALLTFYWIKTKWRISLYGSPHHPEQDLRKIAVKYGGGGHKQACGFECKELPFQL